MRKHLAVIGLLAFTWSVDAQVSSGTIALSGSATFDLDTGATTGGTADDIVYQIISPFVYDIAPVTGAAIVNLGNVNFANVTVNQLQSQTYTISPIAFSPGTTVPIVLGVRTNAGNYAKVEITTFTTTSPFTATIQWVTFAPASLSNTPAPPTLILTLAGVMFWQLRRRFVRRPAG